MTYLTHAQKLLGQAFSLALAHKYITIGALVVLMSAGIGAKALFSSGSEEIAVEPTPRIVDVKSVAELSNNALPLSIVGSVTSEAEATLRAEKSGQITRLVYRLGDRVPAGAIIAEIENRTERASVAQAQAGVDAAKAALAKLTGGSRTEQKDILNAQANNAAQALETAKTSAVNTILSAYAAAESAVPGTADSLFSNPEAAPQFLITPSNSQLKIDAQTQRSQVQFILNAERTRGNTLTTNTDLAAEIARTETELRTVRSFLDTVIAALNVAVPTAPYTETSIATSLSSVTTARTAITTSLSSLSTARDTLAAKETALVVAEKNLEQGIVGGQVEDVAGAEASVRQAEANLALAAANLEKSRIRAPFTGTLNMLDLKQGDFVQALTPVATIANNGTLEVVTYITEGDVGSFSVGSTVRLENGDVGTITRIAPALDPITKKIEMRIALPLSSKLVNGQSVIISAERGVAATAAPVRVTIPITALKINVDGTAVLTVSDENRIVIHPVTIGTLLGERVEILEGLDATMRIVVDARGLRPDQEVTVRY